MPVCVQCGQDNPDVAKFCLACGSPLAVATGTPGGERVVIRAARPREAWRPTASDVINTAARVRSAAPVDGILVGEQTYRATRALFDYRDADPIATKGKSEPVPSGRL